MKICLLLLLPSIGPCLFPAIWVTEDSQLLDRVSCALLHSTTSVSQKQYPAFSAQMEVIPYASRPLSFYLGNQLYTSQGNRRSTEYLNGSGLWLHLHSLQLYIVKLVPSIHHKLFLSSIIHWEKVCLQKRSNVHRDRLWYWKWHRKMLWQTQNHVKMSTDISNQQRQIGLKSLLQANSVLKVTTMWMPLEP